MWPPDVRVLAQSVAGISNVVHLASGGQKAVFRAVHKGHGDVVVKLISSSQPDERAKREIEVATKCTIPNVARLFEWGRFEHEGEQITYLLEEFVDGRTLRKELEDRGRLPKEEALSLLDTLLETAVAIEREGLVHRDIKPENIMVCPDGTFRLLDFGIARHLAKTSITPTQARFGPHTAGYAAPEQIRNMKKEVDIRADLFAIGVVVYEALTGRNPLLNGARDQMDVLHRTEALVFPPLDIPGDAGNQLASFIQTLTSKYASRRPQTAKQAREWFVTIRRQLAPEEQ